MSFNEWKEVRLGDVVSILGDGLHGTPKYNENGEYYFINGNNLDGKIVINDNTKKVGIDEYEKYKKDLDERTLLVSINGTLGKVAEYSGEKIVLGKSACYFNIKEDISKTYIKYVLLSNIFKHYIDVYSTGTTIKNMGLKQMREFKFLLPNIEEQKSIAKILSDLDNKIEVNNKINQRLEEMAQSIFKHWFVDFEFPNEEGKPYKSSGGEMVESELGMIPKGWEIKELGELSNIVGGGTPSTKIEEYYNGDIPWITPKDLSGYDRKFIKSGSRSITQLGLDKSSAKVLPKGSVLFSSRAPIGYISIAENDVTTNQGFKSIDCSEGKISNNYIYYTLINQVEDIKNKATGSTFKEVSGLFMKKLKLIVPNETMLNKFESIIKNNDLVLKKNYRETDILTDLRDTLLPKFMSGEIRVQTNK